MQITVPQNPGVIDVRTSERERSEVLAQAARFRGLPLPIVALLGAATVLLGAYLLVHAVVSPAEPLSPVALILAAIVYGMTAIAYLIFRAGTKPLIDGTYELTPAGLHVTADNRSGIIPWSLIARVIDIGNAFMVERYLTSPPILLPKSAFADGGAAVWDAFERHLSGPRLLVRPSAAARTIVNTLAPQPRGEHHDH